MIADRIAGLLGATVTSTRPSGGGAQTPAHLVELADGRRLFAKTREDAPDGFFHAEARGLRWLAEADATLVPAVHAVTDDMIVIDWIDQAPATADAAEALGRALAAVHRSGAPSYGADWPGFIGPLPMDNTPMDNTPLDNTPASEWPAFYAERRVEPYLREARDDGILSPAGAATIEDVLTRLPELAGPPEPPARIHGDLWGGNVLWTPGGARLVDPAAHGGHRETDLAMLQLFGVAHQERLLAAYDEVFPLADGWRARVPLHQLHPLLVHTVLFGAGYGARAVRAARAALAAG